MPAAAIISVLSLFAVPAYWALGGFDHMTALGWREIFSKQCCKVSWPAQQQYIYSLGQSLYWE
jgi:hypothetical protein